MSDLLPKQTCIGAVACPLSAKSGRYVGRRICIAGDAACDGKGRAVEKHRRMADHGPTAVRQRRSLPSLRGLGSRCTSRSRSLAGGRA